MIRWFVLVCLLPASASAWAHMTAMDKDGMLLVDGKRCFILGLYEEAANDAFAEEASKAGFNLIRVGATPEALDRAAKYGLQCWIPLGGLPVKSDDEAAKLKEIVNAFKSHAALSVWEAPDEALWNEWWGRLNRAQERWKQVGDAINAFQGSEEQKKALQAEQQKWNRYRGDARYELAEAAEEQIRKIVGLPPAEERLSDWRKGVDSTFEYLQRGCEIVRGDDSGHVIWFNHAPRNSMSDLKKYGTLADVVGCDIYPVPFGLVGHSDLGEKNLPCVGRFTERMAQSVPGKPAWMVLQGFGWDVLGEGKSETSRPEPTLRQSRFMAYDAVVNGARGILYWGTFVEKKDSPFWAELKQVVSELRDLQPFLSAPDANARLTFTPAPSAASDEKGVRWLAKEREGQWVILLANESDSAQAFEIGGLDALNGRVFEALGEGESLLVENGKLYYGLPSLTAVALILK